MRALLQRTSGARVRVGGTVVGEVGGGLVVLVGVGPDDDGTIVAIRLLAQGVGVESQGSVGSRARYP